MVPDLVNSTSSPPTFSNVGVAFGPRLEPGVLLGIIVSCEDIEWTLYQTTAQTWDNENEATQTCLFDSLVLKALESSQPQIGGW
jgi:hypothetical protein